MATHSTLSSLFTDIANALRNKGLTGTIKADDFPTKINNLPNFFGNVRLSSSEHFVGAAGGANKFVLLTDNGNVYYSSDAINWTKKSNPIVPYCMTFGRGKFLQMGSGSGAYSSDGVNWTTFNHSCQSQVTNGISALKANSNKFIYIPDRRDSNNLPIYTSSDGINWTTSYAPQYHISGPFKSIACSDSIYVIATRTNGTNGYNLITSSDGLNWIRPTIFNSQNLYGAEGLSYGNGKFFVAAGHSNLAWVSTDGTNWSSVSGYPKTENYNRAGEYNPYTNKFEVAYGMANAVIEASTSDGNLSGFKDKLPMGQPAFFVFYNNFGLQIPENTQDIAVTKY